MNEEKMVRGKLYDRTTKIEFISDLMNEKRLQITESRFLCFEDAERKKHHIRNYEYERYDSIEALEKEDSYCERDDLWEYIGLCDGTCEENYHEMYEEDLKMIMNPYPDYHGLFPSFDYDGCYDEYFENCYEQDHDDYEDDCDSENEKIYDPIYDPEDYEDYFKNEEKEYESPLSKYDEYEDYEDKFYKKR